MDAVPLTIACLPLGLYMLMLGITNLRRRPKIVRGPSDSALLAIAVSGLVMIGPMNLFLPQGAALRFGPVAWPILFSLYALCVLLYLLVARPRLVVYNIAQPQLRQVIDDVTHRLDSATRFAGDAVQLPQLDVQFHLETSPAMRNVSLVSTGDRQSHTGWQKLHRELKTALAAVTVPSNPRGFSFIAVGLFLLCWPGIQLLHTPSHQVAQQLRDMLRM